MPVILLRRAVIDETIDCLVADKGATVVSRQPAGDLLGRQSHRKALPDQISQVRLARQLEATIPPAPTVGQTLRASRIIATAPRPPRLAVAPQFPTDRRRAAIQRPRDRAQRFAVCSQTANLNPLGQAKLLVPSSHRNTILRCCTCSVNSGYPWRAWTPASAGEARRWGQDALGALAFRLSFSPYQRRQVSIGGMDSGFRRRGALVGSGRPWRLGISSFLFALPAKAGIHRRDGLRLPPERRGGGVRTPLASWHFVFPFRLTGEGRYVDSRLKCNGLEFGEYLGWGLEAEAFSGCVVIALSASAQIFVTE